MFLRKFLLLLISSIIVSSQKSSDSSSAVATVSVVFTTPAVEKSTSLIPTNRVTTTPTAAVLPTTSISNTVVKSTETASISAVPSPTLSSFTVSTSSSTANSTLTVPDVLGEIIGDPESYEVAEIDYPPDVPSPDELVDLSAYQIDLYAADVASGEHQIIASGSDEGAKVVLPVCPDVGPLSSGPKKRAAKKAVFDCTPNSLSIPVHIHWVVNKTKTAEEMTNMETKMYQQLIFLESVFTKYHKIKLVRQGVVRQIVKSTFAENLRYPSPDHPRNQANKQFMEETRIGTAHILNIWIVDTIFRVDAKKKRSPVNAYAHLPGTKNFELDGIVIRESRLGSGQMISEKDRCTKEFKQRVVGGTLLHELGHWMGLRHPFDGGCKGQTDYITGTAAFDDSEDTIYCCAQTVCGSGTSPKIVLNWMSYSICRATFSDGTIRPNSFTPGQKAMMYAQFLTFRLKQPCKAKLVGALPTRDEHAALQKREVDKATILADLLLQNCSVAIQAVFQEDSIPLPKSVLQSYSSAASSMQANPTSYPPGAERPATATRQSALPTGTDTADSTAEKKPNGSGGNGDLVNASMFGFVGWFFGLLLLL